MPAPHARSTRRRTTARVRGQRGASAVEFAFVMLPLFYLIFGIIQYGWYFYVAETTSSAASSVTRRLAVGDCWTGEQARDLARSQSAMVTGVVKVPANLTGAAPGVTQLTVTVSADANILNVYPMPNGGIVTKVAKARLEDTVAGPECA